MPSSIVDNRKQRGAKNRSKKSSKWGRRPLYFVHIIGTSRSEGLQDIVEDSTTYEGKKQCYIMIIGSL
jgi:hypothetical protein